MVYSQGSDSGQTGAPRYLHDMAISPPSAGRPAGGGEGVSEKFSGKVFPKGVGNKHHRVSDVSGTSFCTTRRVAVHVFPGTRAQVYTRDATHRPTATSTPGRGTFLCPVRGIGGPGGGKSPNFPKFPKFSEIFEKK